MCRALHEGHNPKVILVAHALPMTNEGDVDEETLISWLTEADFVFSVGDRIKAKIDSCIEANDIPTAHKPYLPGFPLDFFKIEQEEHCPTLIGEQNIVVMTRERENLQVSGLNFELAVVSTARTSQNILAQEKEDLSKQLSFTLKLIAAREDEKESWKKNFNTIKDKYKLQSGTPSFRFEAPPDVKKVMPHMKGATVLVLPLKQDSPLFGTEALVAMAASVPVLVSRNSGIASFLQSIGEVDPIVWDNEDMPKDTRIWKERLIQKIKNPEQAQHAAKELRKALLLGAKISSTHLDFIKSVTKCTKLVVKFDAAQPVSAECLDEAREFGVELGHPSDPISTQAYVVAYFKHLICQREKLDNGLLADHIKPAIAEMWQKVLSSLEERNKRAVDAERGSVTFTLFCQSRTSLEQLQDEQWKKEVAANLQAMMKLMGVEADVRVHHTKEEMKQIPSPWLHVPKRQHSAESVSRSEGYATLPSGGSDLLSEILSKRKRKVDDWLTRQDDTGSFSTASTLAQGTFLTAQETWNLDYIVEAMSLERFAISHTGTIAIASYLGKPSLSVMYPGTKKPPLSLSAENSYRCAVFIQILGKEYLAATCNNDHRVFLWDVERGTSEVVYNMDSDGRMDMNLCVLDNDTVAYGAGYPSSDGVLNIDILNAASPRTWIWKRTLKLTPGVKNVWDMCHMRTSDGASCLVMTCPSDFRVQAVELEWGETLWQTDKGLLGKYCYPLSVCVGDDHMVYVADLDQFELHMLSSEDGSLIRSMSLYHLYITSPFCVRIQDDVIYVGHADSKMEKHRITKFTKSENVVL